MSERLPPPRFRISRVGRKSLLKPQHRIVLGLVAMSAGALLMTLLYPAKDVREGGEPGSERPAAAPVARPPTPGTTAGAAAEVPLPAVPTTGTAEPAVLGPRVEALSGALAACAADPAGFAPADGRLELRVELGTAGLEGAFVEGLPALSGAAPACLAGALGAQGWPTADPPVAVRVPFFVVQPVGRPAPEAPPAPEPPTP